MSNQFYTLTVSEIIKESINAVSVIFNLPEEHKAAYKYEAGQYLTLLAAINGEELRRAYSLSSCPKSDEHLKVSVKEVENGKMSRYLCSDLKVGDQLQVMQPQGTFTDNNKKSKLVLFAAGSGITPIISILKNALCTGDQTIELHYGNRTEEETMFRQELRDLKAKYGDRINTSWYFSSEGMRLTSSIASEVAENNMQADFFICGPEGMIASVKQGLENADVDSNSIHIEFFASPKTEKPKTQTVLTGEVNEVTLVLDDEQHKVTLNPQETILEAGERIGIDPPFSCQSGVCTTCRAKVLQGEVEMENNFGLGEDEVEEGYVLTCICTPKSPGVVISWDED